MICIGLILYWMRSVETRLLPAKERSYIIASAVLMFLYLLVLDVLRELTASMTSEEIAERLHIYANTVKRHLQNIMEKTGFASRQKLTMNVRMLILAVHEEDRTNTNSS